MQGRNAQVARIYRILLLLEAAPHGLSALEIWTRLRERDFEVSKRTVYRDLEALSDAGFPLFPEDGEEDEGTMRWVLKRGAKSGQPLAFTPEELMALHLARGLLKTEFDKVFRKIEDGLGKTHKAYLEELSSEIRFEATPGIAIDLDGELLETIRAACAESQVLSVEYDSVHSGTKRRRRLGPHYVYCARGSVYLIAEDLEDHVLKFFALPRMSDAVMENEPFEKRPLEHVKVFEGSFGVKHSPHPAAETGSRSQRR